MEGIRLKVECYAGYRGEQEPRAFVLGGSRRGVVELLDRWISPDRRYFRLRADDGGTYIIQHDQGEGWFLVFYDSGTLNGLSLSPGSERNSKGKA